jgi:hypothetical protein
MRKRRFKDEGGLKSFATSFGVCILALFGLCFVGALISQLFENSRGAVNYISLAVILVSGAVSGFISRKITGSFGAAILPGVSLCLLLAALSGVAFGYSLSAFMNEACYALCSVVGAYLARDRRRKRR